MKNNVINEAENKNNTNTIGISQCVKQAYIESKKREALNVDIKMPSDFGKPFMIAPPPQDLKNLMQDFPKDEKFKNIRNMMSDPTKTFNNALDNAMNMFGSLEKLCISNTPDNSKAMNNNTDGTNTHANIEYESLLMYGDEEYALNEEGGMGAKVIGGAVTTATSVAANTAAGGAILGGAAGMAFGGFATGVLAGAAAFGATAAAPITALFGAGYLYRRINNGAISGGGYIEDAGLVNSNKETKDYSNLNTDKAWHGEDAIEAINKYLSTLTSSMQSVFADIVGKPEGFNEFVAKIDEYVAAEDKLVKQFVEKNSSIVKQMKDEWDTNQKFRYQTEGEKNALNNVSNFVQHLSEVFKNCANNEVIIKGYIIQYYVNNKSKKDEKTKRKIENLEDWQDKQLYVKFYNENINKNNGNTNHVNKLIIEEGVINEDETETLERPQIDVTNLYNNLKGEFKKMIDAMFPLRGGDNLPGIAEAKANMEKLKDEANKEITSKIELICRLTNNGDNNGLTDKIKGFISKHPMQASTLTTLWGRHMSDLDTRMNNRLALMKDYGNTNFILGWTANFCRTVIPEVLARMLSIRYVLSVLKEEGYYTYTTESEKADNEIFTQVEEDWLLILREYIIIALQAYGHEYTLDGSAIVIEQNGTETLSGAIRSYIIFLILNYFEKIDDKVLQAAISLSTFNGSIEEFADNIMTLIIASGKFDIMALDNCYLIQQSVLINTKYTEVRNVIKEAFDRINAIGNSIEDTDSNIDFERSLNSIITYPEILDIYRQNKDKVKAASDTYYNESSSAEDKEKAEKEIKDLFKGKRILNEDVVGLFHNGLKSILVKPQGQYDIYTFIYTLYKSLMLSNIFDFKPIEQIKEICDTLIDTLEIMSLKVLVLGSESSPYMERLMKIVLDVNQIKQYNIRPFCIDFYPNIEDITDNEKRNNDEQELDYEKNICTNFTNAIKDIDKISSCKRNGEKINKPNFDIKTLTSNIDTLEILFDSEESVIKLNNGDISKALEELETLMKFILEYSVDKANDNVYTKYNSDIFNAMGRSFATINGAFKIIDLNKDSLEEHIYNDFVNEYNKIIDTEVYHASGIKYQSTGDFFDAVIKSDNPKDFWENENTMDKNEDSTDNIQSVYNAFNDMKNKWKPLYNVISIIDEIMAEDKNLTAEDIEATVH